ncbi:8-amino-7-oxononanoate synthase [Boletus edulis BED1]|uniref:8-amino-7-oxononanoate synthase n=1 Tax=Boletus edulis BED1 TaxID=1328754 RepID=A0AAD4BSP5_BOLED|nr:8-amino-7-oxononanoate synthase [Boletus edulis BED1]
MSQPSALQDSLQQALVNRAKDGFTVFRLDEPLPSSAPDFFSNNYLSLSTDQSVREIFLRSVQATAPARLLGSTGSRLATGNSFESNSIEAAFKHFFRVSSALLMGSCYSANVAFLAAVPQKNDIIVYDELVHVSSREGVRGSSCASYRFAHNSVASLKKCLLDVLQKHPQVSRGTSTVFVLLESLYSMEGDFCPLTEIVELVETFVPAGHGHIVVDEAHTSATCGPNGTGYVSCLGLNDRVHTQIHSFGKGWGLRGAVVLTSPIVREYLINFATSLMYSTAITYTDIYALEACLSVVSSARGQELRQRLNCLSHYAREKLFISLKNVPETILAIDVSDAAVAVSESCTLFSPIIPVYTPRARSLADYLLERGYAVSPLTYPVVRRPRIRISIHASNTEEQIDAFVNELLAWAERQERVFPLAGNTNSNAEVGKSSAEERAKL